MNVLIDKGLEHASEKSSFFLLLGLHFQGNRQQQNNN